MSARRNQYGLAAVEAVLFLVLAGIIGFTGYKVFQSRNTVNDVSQNALDTSNKQKIPASAAEAPTVRNAGDLDKAQAALDKENPDDNGSDLNELNHQTNF